MKNYIFFLFIIVILFGQEEYLNTKWSGEFRLRSTFRSIDLKQNSFHELRTRISLSIQQSDEIQLFMQLQDSRWLGSASQLENSKNADFHQIYLQIKNIFMDKLNLKLGRFEQVFSNGRLVGNVGFSNVGRSFDGAILSFDREDSKTSLFNFRIFEASNPNSLLSYYDSDRNDNNFYGIHQSMFSKNEYRFDLYYFSQKFFASDFSKNYIGFFTEYFYNNLKITAEFNQLFGKKNIEIEYSANLLNTDLRYKLNDDLSLNIGAEVISGDDSTTTKSEAFENLFPTQHIYNGLMDYHYTALSAAVPHDGSGLKDIYFGFTYKSLTVSYHQFMLDKAAKGKKENLGGEIDLLYKIKYSKELSFELFAGTYLFADYQNKNETNDYYFYLSTFYSF
jgi:hypothetical protein